VYIGIVASPFASEPDESATSSPADAQEQTTEDGVEARDAEPSAASEPAPTAAPVATTVPATTVDEATATTTEPATTTTQAPATTTEPATTTTQAPTTTTEPPRPRPVDQVGADGLPANPGEFYPDRLGIEDNDHETLIGDEGGTAYNGWNIYVDEATIDGARLTFTARLFNRQDTSRSYGSYEWGLQHPSGEIRGSLIVPTDASGSLASGGTAEVTVAFNIEDRSSGDWVYLIHEPLDFIDSARGIWGFRIP
jgi:hypothetical protein